MCRDDDKDDDEGEEEDEDEEDVGVVNNVLECEDRVAIGDVGANDGKPSDDSVADPESDG
jgi:hypothetical protein